jgi:mRNA-degrading endonuclease RelE of RelBE toxin-antitoxin system
MSIERSQIEISLTPRFRRDLRDLNKRYRSIRTDLQPLIDRLQAGEVPGDRVTGLPYPVFKVRLKNSNIQKGKSGGYRVVYYLKSEEKVILVTIYSKSDFTDVSNDTIEDAIGQYDREVKFEKSIGPNIIDDSSK